MKERLYESILSGDRATFVISCRYDVQLNAASVASVASSATQSIRSNGGAASVSRLPSSSIEEKSGERMGNTFKDDSRDRANRHVPRRVAR